MVDISGVGDYREKLLAAVRAVRLYRGTESQSEAVLSSLISAEEWQKSNLVDTQESALCIPRFNPKAGADPNGNVGKAKATPTIDSLLGRALDRFVKFTSQSNDPEEVAKSLGIPFRALPGVVLIPDPQEVLKQESEAGETQELKYEPRLQWLIAGLKDIEIYVDDLVISAGMIRAEQMRKVSYAIVEIPRLNAEVLVCNQVGEATFVCTELKGAAHYIKLGKEELGSQDNIFRVIFHGKGQWLGEVLGYLKDLTKEQKVNVRNREELRSALKEHYSLDQFVKMSQPEKRKVKISGSGLNAISRAFGVEGNVISNNIVCLRLAAKIWQGELTEDFNKKLVQEEKKEAERIQNAQLAEELKKDPEKIKSLIKEHYSLEKFADMSQAERLNVTIGGMGLQLISSLFGIEGRIVVKIIHLRLVAKIWDGELTEAFNDKLAKEERSLETKSQMDPLVKNLKADPENLRVLIKEKYSLDEFAALPYGAKKQVCFCGLYLTSIATVFGVEGNVISNKIVALRLAAKIWEGELTESFSEKLAQEETIEADRIKNLPVMEKLKKDPDQLRGLIKAKYSLEEFAELYAKARGALDFAGFGLVAISTAFGVSGDPVAHRIIHLRLAAKIWEGELTEGFNRKLAAEEEKKAEEKLKSASLVTDFKQNPEKLLAVIKARYSLDEFVGLPKQARPGLDFSGFGLLAIAAVCGVKGNPFTHKINYLRLAARIWEGELTEDFNRKLVVEEENETQRLQSGPLVAELKKDPEKLRGAIKAKYSLNVFAELYAKDRLKLDFFGLRIFAIATAFGVKGNPVANKIIYLRLAAEIWKGELTPEFSQIYEQAKMKSNEKVKAEA